jgi:two-component system sensor histidine kinase QseC
MPSIRRRLLVALALGFTVLVAAAAIFVERSVRSRLTDEFDATLVAHARAMSALTEVNEKGQIEFDYSPAHMPEYERAADPDYFQFWRDDGSPSYRSPRLPRDLPPEPSASGRTIARDVALPDGRRGRQIQVAFTPNVEPEEDDDGERDVPRAAGPPRTLVLVVARGRDPLDRLIAATRWTVFGAGGATILLALVLVWRALAIGLRPVDVIARRVGSVDAERLGTRIVLPRAPVELAPIVAQVNAMLVRLEESFARERRFTGNVAHELRTPIAELRSLAEVGARWADDRESVERFFGDVRDIAARMETVIADLLLLARCQAGVERIEPAPTAVRAMVSSTWARYAVAASSTGLRLHLDVPDDLVVESDPGKLEILLSNVLGNAVSYARPNGEIRCVGGRDGERFRLEIANPAEPLADGDLAHLAEPFWRGDRARSASDHAGLGLSVVAAVATLLRMDVGFVQDRDGTFRVRLAGILSPDHS